VSCPQCRDGYIVSAVAPGAVRVYLGALAGDGRRVQLAPRTVPAGMVAVLVMVPESTARELAQDAPYQEGSQDAR